MGLLNKQLSGMWTFLTCVWQNAPPVQLIDVDKVVVHEKFKPSAFDKGNDIALVRLKTMATLFYVG